MNKNPDKAREVLKEKFKDPEFRERHRQQMKNARRKQTEDQRILRKENEEMKKELEEMKMKDI